MGLNAQRYPITVIPRVNPPAPVNFFNYADATTFNSPLSVRLLLNDITITDRQITLKVYFEGNGIQFQSKDFVVGAPTLTISGGEPIDLTNVELAPYFELQNIIGINPNTYGQVIPEGSYQFCFEVFDFITGNRLSDRTCATTYIFRNDPPILNLPANKINLEPQPVDNIVFQWTPRHINVSNVQYELSIVEIWDDTVDPQTAFLTSPPIFQATTRANTFIYGPSNPPLLTDKRYAWQVRAKALQGAEEIGLFRNEGKSEIFWFSRTAPCSPPDNVYAEAKGISKINVFWEENPAIYTEYTIAYREVNKQGAQWFTMTTNSSWATVWDLKPGTTYEYKVKGKCKYQYSEYSQVQEISTEATQDESSNYNCGIVPDAIAISNREPYTGLQVGDRITAGDFIITLTDIESSNGGRVTGKGYVKIPYLEFARFGVKYENILVNTDKQLAEGEIVTLYDPEFGEGEQMDQDVDLDLIEIINGDDGELTYVDVDFDIQDITINDDGAIVITGENGEEAIIPGGEDVVITDSDGTAWTVGEDGTVTQDTLADGGAVTADNTSGVQDGEVTSISASGVIVKFRESGFYAFDQYSNAMPDQLKEKYESLGLPDGEEYKVSYKAISNIKGEDFVELEIEITDQNITKDDIIFKTKQGIEIPVTWKDDLAALSIKKKFEYAKEEILAVVKPKNDNDQYKTAGKLNLMHLGSNKVSNIKLVVIPVNNSSITSNLKEKVNDIYNKAGVHFDISITNSINIPQDAWDLNADGKFDVGDSSVLSYYSDEENALNSYIKERINYQEETYYILVFDQPLSEASLSGFMPLKSQFGFVFGNQDQARVIAHELGHGVFGIEHPFTEYGIAEGSTNLLMDYGGGSELNHLDWKQIHAPGLQLYWFQGDEEGQALFSAKERNDKLRRILEHIGNNYDNNIENLTWKYFITKNHGRNGRVAMNLDGEYNFDLPGAKLYFKIKEQPSSSFAEISVQPDKEVFEIKESSVFGGIYYELSLKTEAGDFVFEFDHHDQLEAFCNYFKINRDREEKLPDNSAYSKQIINYLNENYFPSGGLSANVDCNDIDTYFSEIPTSYLTYTHDTQFINNDKLWIALKSLLSCSVNDKGVSEEDAVINLVEALGKRSGNTFLNALKSEDIDGDNAFRKLYSRIDNWGGDDNFTKLINVLHSIWSKSDYVTQPVVDIPYESSKVLGFYFSSYDVKFSGDTSIKMIEEVIYIVPYAGTIYGDGIIREFKDLGTYDIYDPIRLVKYKNIVDPGFRIESVDIPMFILKAIAENYSTSNTDRGANFAFEAALTFSGIGNIAKLRHISKLGKLKGTLTGLEGADAILSTTNLLLKYSGACDPPKQNETNQQNGEKKKTFCDKLGFFADVVGLASGFTSLAERSVEIKRRADDLLQEIESNPQIIENATDRGAIIDGLKAIIGETDLYDVSLNELRKQIQDGQFASVLNNFENVKLTLSTVEFLLKYSEGCDRDEVCKQVKFFLDIVQKGIKARDLGIKVRKQAGVLLDKVNNDPNAFKNDPLKKKQVIEELELVSGRKIPSLE
ncbi:MAG: hypothetical protein CL613_06030, partial [Aquimarina sp.]|nr:hypothetical protein [Aquimarina sp.]